MPDRIRPEVMALLSEVKENPQDPTPWLVLTDWLEENGDVADQARAEYCRLCFDKLGKKTYASDWEMGERRRELFKMYSTTWFGGFAKQFVSLCRMVRGLLNIHARGEDLIEAIEAGIHVETGLWVHTIVATQLSAEQLVRLVGSSLLEGPYLVELHGAWRAKLTSETVQSLADSPYLNQVQELRLKFSVEGNRTQALKPVKKRFGKRLKLIR